MTEDGIRYEKYCCEYLSERGFTTKTTAVTGDQGVDILAEKDDIRYAVQCKYREVGTVGNDAVQQIIAGKNFYDCDVAVVIANTSFSSSAIHLAEKLRVRLWTVPLPPESTLGDFVNTKENIADFRESIKCLVQKIKDENEELELALNRKNHLFSTVGFPLVAEADNESLITEMMDSISMDYCLLFKKTLFFENIYLYRVAADSNIDFKVFKLSMGLYDNNMFVEKITDNQLVVVESAITENKEFTLSRIERYRNIYFAKTIIKEAKACLGVDIELIIAEKTKDGNTTEYCFYFAQELDPSLHSKFEDYWNKKYKAKVFVDIYSTHKLCVYVSDGEACDANDYSTVLTYDQDGSEDKVVFASALSSIDDSVDVTAVLTQININNLLDSSFGIPYKKETFFIWRDLKNYLMNMYELISVSALHKPEGSDIEMRFDSRGLFVIAPKRRCFRFQVLDKAGHVLLTEEHTDIGGIIFRNYMYDSILRADESVRYIQPGKGYMSVYYRIAELYDTVAEDEESARKLNISDINKEMEAELLKTKDIIEKNTSAISYLLDQLSTPSDDDFVRIQNSNLSNSNMEIITYYRN